MLARIWGCRGSLAAPGFETVKYGGNTPCVEVRLSDGTLIILDAGTGIRPLGVHLDNQGVSEIHLLLTHLHLDHLQGIGFFPPLSDPAVRTHVWGPSSSMKTLEELIDRYLSPPLFPVQLRDLASAVEFHDNPVGEWQIGGATILAEPVVHQGPTVGYRIQENDRTLAYIPDHEPARGTDLSKKGMEWLSGANVAVGADVLIHDTQYFDHEYPPRIGWGHSSVTDSVTFARITDAKKLILFHHDPLHTDTLLETLLGQARKVWGHEGNGPVLAFEGMEIQLE